MRREEERKKGGEEERKRGREAERRRRGGRPRLEGADDARDRPEHAAVRAAGHSVWRRRLREDAAVARPSVVPVDRQLPF
eukprot:1543271-Rhodomonas_salina.3